jgi:chromosomal replication initiator protein
VSAELQYIWSRVQAELAASVDEHVYRIWLEPMRARELADGQLTVEVAPQAQSWVAARYGRLLGACASSALGRDLQVRLVSALEPFTSAPNPTDHSPPSVDTHQLPPSSQPRSPLANPKLTFDQFVIGDANRLAHAAALAVAELPAGAYNPLFICGPPGVGKTHLLGSIAALLRLHSPGILLRYTTGEAFTSEFLHALAGKQTDAFKNRFRQLDVLLVDDVQFLERKTRTEEEFFHTFNTLYDAGHQLVLTSDRPPRDLAALEDRLRERFASGLVADIRPPDPQTRLAILRKRAHHDRIDAPSAVLELLASQVTDNVRALEGALIRVVAFASLTGRPLSAELAVEVLANLYPQAPQPGQGLPPSLQDIAEATCAHFSLTAEELLSSSRASRVAWPRQVAMYLARELTNDSLPKIGRHFGGRDHTTVLYACRRASARISADASAKHIVDELRESLSSSTHNSHPLFPDRPA